MINGFRLASGVVYYVNMQTHEAIGTNGTSFYFNNLSCCLLNPAVFTMLDFSIYTTPDVVVEIW